MQHHFYQENKKNLEWVYSYLNVGIWQIFSQKWTPVCQFKEKIQYYLVTSGKFEFSSRISLGESSYHHALGSFWMNPVRWRSATINLIDQQSIKKRVNIRKICGSANHNFPKVGAWNKSRCTPNPPGIKNWPLLSSALRKKDIQNFLETLSKDPSPVLTTHLKWDDSFFLHFHSKQHTTDWTQKRLRTHLSSIRCTLTTDWTQKDWEHTYLLPNVHLMAGTVTLWLKAQTTLTEGAGSTPSTHISS